MVVKADNGTHGMGVMTVHDAKGCRRSIAKAKNKMAIIKDGQPVHDVIVQEGVLTQERMQDAVAEPVVYMMDRYVVGASTACMPSGVWMRISTLPAQVSCRWRSTTAPIFRSAAPARRQC